MVGSPGTMPVVLVEDERNVREVVRLALEGDGRFDVVGEAADGQSALTVTEATQPGMVVVDLGLPDVLGLDLIPALLDLAPAARVVVFSGSPADADEATAMERGASRYVVKGNVTRLIDALGAVMDSATKVEEDFPAHASSIRRARSAAVSCLKAWGLARLTDDVSLIISELTTNAVLHAKSSFTLRMHLADDALRIEVVDSGAGSPNPRVPDDLIPGGRGLHIVAALAVAWGLEPSPSAGKTVWCELALPRGQ